MQSSALNPGYIFFSFTTSSRTDQMVAFIWVWPKAEVKAGTATLVRVPWAQHPSSYHPKAQLWLLLVAPSPRFSLLPYHTPPLSSCNLPWKTNHPPNKHFFSKQPSHFLIASSLPHYPGPCFCLSWLFWAGGSLGKGIWFKHCMLTTWSVQFLPAKRSWIDKWGISWPRSVYLTMGTWLAASALKGVIH